MLRSLVPLVAFAFACTPQSAELQGAALPDPSAGSSSSAAASAPSPPAPETFMQAIDAARIESDVRFIAHPRPPGSEHHKTIGNRCEERLRANGFETLRQPFASGENIVGTKKGKSGRRVILSAHYDHIPDCPGADDNATGVAVVLEAAKVLGSGAFKNTLVLACWDDEEDGLKGSAAYAARARQEHEDIALMISLDGVGFTNQAPHSQTMPPGFESMFPGMVEQLKKLEFRATFAAVIGDSDAERGVAAITHYGEIAKLPVLGDSLGALRRLALLDAARSDHASFWLQGYPALLVTDTANFRNPRYHCMGGEDSVESLDLGFTTRVARAVTGAVAELLEPESIDPTRAPSPSNSASKTAN